MDTKLKALSDVALGVHMSIAHDLYKRLSHYLQNTAWILADRVLALGVGFIVSVIVARYLGPTQLGILTYTFSIAAIFAAVGNMGLSGLVVREIVKRPDDRGVTLGTSAFLKLLGLSLGALFLTIFAYATEDSSGVAFWLLIMASATIPLQVSVICDFSFQADLQAKYATTAHAGAMLVGASAKIFLVYLSAGLLWFGAANLLQALIDALALLYLYQRNNTVPLRDWRVSVERARELLRQGALIFAGTLLALIYLKIDIIMLKWMAGPSETGIYSVAASLSEAWYFLPSAIVASFFPKLIKLHKSNYALFQHRFQQLLDLLFLMAFSVAVLTTVFAQPAIDLFFGEEYQSSAAILVIHIWAALFIFMRAAFSRWILIENALVFSMATTGVGAILNVFLNFFLIQRYGGVGAAIATLVSYAAASYFSLALYKKTRVVFFMMTLAILAPIRVPCYVIPKGLSVWLKKGGVK